MRTIKKFESFSTNHRLPEEVPYNKWYEKLKIHNKEPFTQKEVDFFKKLVEENSLDVVSWRIGSQITIKMDFDYDIIELEFIKLSDNWYLTSNHSRDEFFICDEWDEVLGYLESKNLKF